MESEARFAGLTIEDVQAAQRRAREGGRSALAELAASTGLPPQRILATLAALFGFDVAEKLPLPGWEPAFDLLPLAKALHKECALFRAGQALAAVLADPFDPDLQVWIESRVEAPLRFYLAPAADINACLARYGASVRAIDSLGAAPPAGEAAERPGERLSLKAISEDASPVVRIVNSLLYDALQAGASDIHIESAAAGVGVRYRLDGVLEPLSTIAGIATGEQIVSRLKVMSALDIAERRLPQDGRFRIGVPDRDIDVRVSIMPSLHGEDAVLRLLDKRTLVPAGENLRLDMLGFDAASLAAIRELAALPYGMLLVTGPTGSGKTTTLYGALSEGNHGRDKIITIEDPVEYELPGVLQIPVNERKGLSFARGLRSILRHDPDKILVGEIRDAETAEIAVQSALTGHLVLTTLHANSVFDVFNRFAHMGIDPYALTSALNGVWAQRLIRTLCPHCAADGRPDPEALGRLGLPPAGPPGWRFRQGRGCDHCRGSGYRGRRAIAEILRLDDRLRELLATRSSLALIKSEAVDRGTRFLREAALDLVRQGLTTPEEVARVTLPA